MKTLVAVLLLGTTFGAIAQQAPEAPRRLGPTPAVQDAAASQSSPLTVNDQLTISVAGVDTIGDRPYRIDPDGTIALPLVGKIRAAGLTVDQFKKELTAQLGLYVRLPQVTVERLTTPANTITVTGAFKNPGVYMLSDRRSLVEVLSAVGGLQPNAARTIKITRRLDGDRPPLPSGVTDPTARVSTATINVGKLMENPGAPPILLEPNDVLLAGPAGVVFLTGEVLKPGPVEMVEKESFPLTELISIGGGFGREAAPEKTKILRPILNGSRRAEIAVDVNSILDGRRADFPVMPNDMVVVPRAKGKAQAMKKMALYIVPAVATSLIFVAARR